MTGISNSNNPTAAALAAIILLGTASARADTVELGPEDRIAGRVTDVDAQGQVTIQSELSDIPLRILPDTVSRIVFESQGKAPAETPDQQLELHNGDLIPCRVLAMDEDSIRISTWFAGNLEVPRKHAAALHFGVTDPAMLLSTRDAIKGWSESEAWTITDQGVFVSGGTGLTSRELKPPLPPQFIVRFRYEWKGSPNLRFYFANDLPKQGVADRYMLSINRAGMELKRQSTRGRTNHTLAQDHRQPKDISPDGMDIEIRVNRNERILHLLINGDLVDRFIDPVDHVPKGSGLMIESAASGSSSNFVSGLEVLEWTDKPQSRRLKSADDPDNDTVLDRQGEHFSGTAEAIVGAAGKTEIRFRHPHAADPLRVPLDQAAALFFRKPGGEPRAVQPRLALALSDAGSLALESCQIDDKSARCSHPLLGELKIDRRAIRGLNFPPSDPPLPEK